MLLYADDLVNVAETEKYEEVKGVEEKTNRLETKS